MEKRDSRFDGPITAKQLAVIIWGPIIIGVLVWLYATTVSKHQREAAERSRATNAAYEQNERSRRNLDQKMKDLEALRESVDANPR